MAENKVIPPKLNTPILIIFWLAVLSATTYLFNDLISDINNPNKQLSISTAADGSQSLTLIRNRYGHYVTTGGVNGKTVEFLLDTGATLVAIPEHIAAQLGLEKGQRFQSQTANGNSTSYMTHIDSISIGHITMNNVPASISTGMEFDEILLGMSFLKHLHMTQKGKELQLTIPAQ